MLSRFELRRFRGVLPVLALLFAMLVPVIYGAVYLWANWDPYGQLSKLPVAIVNDDKPVELDGEKVHAGQDITDELIEGHTFDWRTTDTQDAETGLREGRYFLVMEIPENFSADLISASSSDPERAEITLRRNDANGFVIGSVTGSAQSKIESAVDKAAVEAYFRAVFKNLDKMREGMITARDGAAQLADGNASALDGAHQLTDGLTSAKDGSGKLAAGLGDAKGGSAQLAAGLGDAKEGSAQLAAGLGTAKEGSAQLAGGAKDAKAGADKLAAGAGKLSDNMPALRAGADELKSGLDQLDTGSAKVADGAHQVADGTQQLNDAVVPVLDKVVSVQKTVATDVNKINDRVQTLNDRITGRTTRVTSGLDEVDAALAQVIKENPELKDASAYADLTAALEKTRARATKIEDTSQTIAGDSETANAKVQEFVAENKAAEARSKLIQLNDGAHQVADGADQLHAGIRKADGGAGKLATAIGQVADGVEQLGAGAGQLSAGLTKLADGATTLDAGIGKLQTGATKLDSGLAQLSAGATKLDSGLAQLLSGGQQLDGGLGKLVDGGTQLGTGLSKLADGSVQLRDGLADGVEQIPNLSKSQEDQAALVLSSPANVTMDVLNAADVYGRGLAPLFFSIAMWVFGISGFLVMRPITGRLLAGRLYPLRLAVSAWLPFGTVGLLGAGLMLAITWGLGLAPVHPWHTIGLTVLASVVFSGIAHFMRTALNLPGSALLLVWLVLQLSSTGGTYPTEVLPEFFQAIHPFMPISYTIDAYRFAISGGMEARFWSDVMMLLFIGGLAMFLDVVAVMARQRFRLTDLHPPLQH